ncbi:MAG: hypothetical protein ACKVOS_03550 [Sphingorhabdus sp.]
MAERRVHPLLDGSFWAGSGRSASVRGSMNSCRLGRLERLAAVANFSVIPSFGTISLKQPFVNTWQLLMFADRLRGT